MPSWNIHTAMVERVFADCQAGDLGIDDENAFLFGNYVPDIYVGFMVPDASFHIDYCATHAAAVARIPVPDADWFWDHYIGRRCPSTPVGRSLALGAWAHLVADRFYNGRFRMFCFDNDVPDGEELRKGKQADFELFGRSLQVSSFVEETQELLDVSWSFLPHRILPDDVKRAIEVANGIVRESIAKPATEEGYRLLDAGWMTDVLDASVKRVAIWLAAWQKLVGEGRRCMASDVREAAGLPPATPDDPNWEAKMATRWADGLRQ